MKKKVYLLLITILIGYNNTLSNPFREGIDNPYEIDNPFRDGIDNPYEVEKKTLTDSQLAQQLQNEKYEAADQEKLDTQINNLKKLWKKYIKTYRDFVQPNESIKIFKRNENIETIDMKDDLISMTGSLIGKDNLEKKNIQRSIEREIKEYQNNLYKLNRDQKSIISYTYSMLICYKKLNNFLPLKSKAKEINPGAQGTFDAIIKHQLIKDYELERESLLVVYFWLKEHIGELEGRLRTIDNLMTRTSKNNRKCN